MMAKEKFIIGKKDDAAHCGRAGNVRRELRADNELLDYLEGIIFEDGDLSKGEIDIRGENVNRIFRRRSITIKDI